MGAGIYKFPKLSASWELSKVLKTRRIIKWKNNEEEESEYNYYISLLLQHTFSYFTIFEYCSHCWAGIIVQTMIIVCANAQALHQRVGGQLWTE